MLMSILESIATVCLWSPWASNLRPWDMIAMSGRCLGSGSATRQRVRGPYLQGDTEMKGKEATRAYCLDEFVGEYRMKKQWLSTSRPSSQC